MGLAITTLAPAASAGTRSRAEAANEPHRPRHDAPGRVHEDLGLDELDIAALHSIEQPPAAAAKFFTH